MSSIFKSLLAKINLLEEKKQDSNKFERLNSEAERLASEVAKPIEDEKRIEKQIDDEFSEFESDSVSSDSAKTQPMPVYLGIDFGTSFSKLAYWVDSNNRGAIDINGEYFINTAVYINGKSISVTRKGDEATEIRYFKYEMIPKNGDECLFSINMKNAIDKLCGGSFAYASFSKNCSIFFVAYLLKCCDEAIRKKFSNYQLFVNMGMPVADGVAKQHVFEEILSCAYLLFINDEVCETLDYTYLAERCASYRLKCGRYKFGTNYPLYVTSEVIAEADFLLHQETYGIGKYVIVDVGGGTADFAFVQKCAGTQIGDYDLIWYSIVPHGIETAKINPQYTFELGRSYASFLKDSKVMLDSKGSGYVTFILFGGGSNDDRVKAVIKNIARKYPEISKQFILRPDERSFPEHHQIGHLRLSESDKKRLVIACQLSYPERPKVAIMPPTQEGLNAIKNYSAVDRGSNKKSKRTKQSGPSYHEKLEDRQRELYGN